MHKLFVPLNNDEIERLDQFLIDRIDDDANTDGKDEGVLDISELDGLFTAIVSGPGLIPPSRWLPLVWGDFEPIWKDQTELQQIIALMMRHMNSIANMLMEHPQDFEPLFLESNISGAKKTIVDEWCNGYMRGVEVDSSAWDEGGQVMRVLLTPIKIFTHPDGWQQLDKLNQREFENIQHAITPNVREIHAFWLARRSASTPKTTPMQRSAPQVGRNDPCPCSSGKKYKKCCLH